MKHIRHHLGSMTLLFFLLSFSLTACGGSTPAATSRPATPTSVPFASGPSGLPLYCPEGVTLDSQSNIYVSDNYATDKGYARLVKLSPSGQLLAEWHPFKVFMGGQHIGPYDLAVDTQGAIYVADATDDTVKKLAASGQVLAAWGGTGSAPGQLNGPIGVAVDPQGNVYVSEFNNSRVQKFSSMGKVLAVLGTTGPHMQQLNHPTGVAVDAQGNLYVNDHRNNRIVKFSSAGKFLAAWVPLESEAGLFILPEGLAVDAQGNIYVAANQHLFKLSPTGKVLTIWDKSPYGISDLAVDSQGNVYATEDDNEAAQLEKLSPTGKTLATWKALCTTIP
jgi:DNA-binding beta-propeller fold protein YncE